MGYLGYWRDEKLSTIAIGVLFAPLGTTIAAWWLADRSQARRPFLVAAALAAIGPTLFFGSGSPPRFEFVNLTVVLLTYIFVSSSTLAER
ncbi:MAG: hypothetical protein EXQ55_09155 [Acidobacteria bacterium]|nr:hypothetical protein [Acidobacteriota bacterium]